MNMYILLMIGTILLTGVLIVRDARQRRRGLPEWAEEWNRRAEAVRLHEARDLDDVVITAEVVSEHRAIQW
jgi:hypothetical protein